MTNKEFENIKVGEFILNDKTQEIGKVISINFRNVCIKYLISQNKIWYNQDADFNFLEYMSVVHKEENKLIAIIKCFINNSLCFIKNWRNKLWKNHQLE